MTSHHTIHALMVGMSENWWRAGIMPCLRSDLERDKPVAYIFWLIDGPTVPSSSIPVTIPTTLRRSGRREKISSSRPRCLGRSASRPRKSKPSSLPIFIRIISPVWTIFPRQNSSSSGLNWNFGRDRLCATRFSTGRFVRGCARRWKN